MKKYLSLILALGICMSMCVFPAAAISANEAENEVLTEDELQSCLLLRCPATSLEAFIMKEIRLLLMLSRLRRQHLSGPSLLKRHPKILTWNTAQSRTPF